MAHCEPFLFEIWGLGLGKALRVFSLSSMDIIVPRIKFQKVAQKVVFPEYILLVRTSNQSTAIVNWQTAFSFVFI